MTLNHGSFGKYKCVKIPKKRQKGHFSAQTYLENNYTTLQSA